MQEKIVKILNESLTNARRRYMNNTLTPKNASTRGHICNVDWCERPAFAKGYCNAHYIRTRTGIDMDLPIASRNRNGKCHCGKKLNQKASWGMCANHYKIERKRVIKQALIQALGGECEKCQEIYPQPVFDFHHLGNKDAGMAKLILNASVNTIAKEAAKCKLLCANCHRLEHFEDGNN